MATTSTLLASKAKAKAKTAQTGKKKPIGKQQMVCLIHPSGVTELSDASFYLCKGDSIFSQTGRVLICKDCCKKLYQKYYTQTQDAKLSMYYTCRKMDIAFVNQVYESSWVESKEDWTGLLGFYMKNYNSLGSANGWNYSFDDSQSVEETAQDVDDRYEKIESANKLTKDEKQARKDVIQALDEDPFEQFPISDQKYLYKKLIDYFKDEDILEDTYKVSQITQLVLGNNQIRIFSNELARLNMNPIANIGDIKLLNNVIKDIVANNDKIAKENGISEKNKRSQSSGGNTLGSLMKNMRSLGFEESEQDYYDMKKAYGMQQAEIKSLQNIKEQIMFDDQDIDDMITYQRELIRDLQQTNMDKDEQIRSMIEGDNNGTS